MRNRILAIVAGLAMTLGVTGLVTTPATASYLEGAAPIAAAKSSGVSAPKGMPGITGKMNAKATCGSPSTCFTYNGVYQFIGSGAPGVGADAVMVSTSQHKTYKDSADFHSLWEISAQGPCTAGGDCNIVEVGWTRDAAVCGATIFATGNPCLFVFHWKNGVRSCYNGCGWQDNPAESVNAGVALATTAGGASPTVFYEYKIERVASTPTWCTGTCTATGGGWQVRQQNVGSSRILGYYPDSLWTGVGETFTKIHQVQAFQETATSDDHTCTDMGSGIFAPASWGTLSASQWQKAYTVTNAPAGFTPDWTATSGSPSPATTPSFNNPTAFRWLKDPSSNEMRIGGPGYDVQGGTVTGTAGNC